MPKTKICSKCEIEKEMNIDNFYKRNSSKDGFRNECKKCILKQRKKYREENKEEIARRNKEWRINNHGITLKNSREYYAQNKEYCLNYQKQYREENKNILMAKDRLYYKENKDYIAKRSKQYYRDNIHTFRLSRHRRRSKVKTLPSTLTTEEYKDTLEHFNNSCAYCGMPGDEHYELFNEQLHQDHFIPINNNGGYTKCNIVPSCKSCNSSKHIKDFSEWYGDYEHNNKDRERKILDFVRRFNYESNTR